jgi:hypothetical protein
MYSNRKKGFPELPFPVSPSAIIAGFSTSSSLQNDPVDCLTYVPLDDDADRALGVRKVTSRTTHNIVTPPKPSYSKSTAQRKLPDRAWEAFYPEGSINPSGAIAGGFGFYFSGPQGGFREELEAGAKEVILGYRVMFEEGWEWRKGGKLPGVCESITYLHYFDG